MELGFGITFVRVVLNRFGTKLNLHNSY